jgi:UDP-N-acetylglucosamine 2-epimerase (non-hydrolysing)
VLNAYYFEKKDFYDQMASDNFFKQRGIERGEYYLMTCHRRENVHIRESFENILNLLDATDRKIFFAASYRTQKVLLEYELKLPDNVIMVDPIGYQETLVLMVNSRGVITDSGTVVEETCVLQVPSLQIRKATERPQVYDVGSSVKYDPTQPDRYPHDIIFHKFEDLFGKKWEHNLGDGKASERIVNDLLNRLRNNGFRMHKPEDYHLEIARSYREDEL